MPCWIVESINLSQITTLPAFNDGIITSAICCARAQQFRQRFPPEVPVDSICALINENSKPFVSIVPTIQTVLHAGAFHSKIS